VNSRRAAESVPAPPREAVDELRRQLGAVETERDAWRNEVVSVRQQLSDLNDTVATVCVHDTGAVSLHS
jgi:uncharacterized coiled-coil DUF342 family protein